MCGVYFGRDLRSFEARTQRIVPSVLKVSHYKLGLPVVSYVIVKTDLPQAIMQQRRKSKRKDHTLFFLFPSACIPFSWRHKRWKFNGRKGADRRKRKSSFPSVEPTACVNPFRTFLFHLHSHSVRLLQVKPGFVFSSKPKSMAFTLQFWTRRWPPGQSGVCSRLVYCLLYTSVLFCAFLVDVATILAA